MKHIEVIYEDDFCVVVNKPAGLAVQGGERVKSSLDKILAEMRSPTPLLVHRLDKDTSGVLLAAKGREAAARFSRLLGGSEFSTGGKAVKQYIAVCSSQPEKPEGVIRQDLIIKGKLKKSETRYKVIKNGTLKIPCGVQEYSVLEIELGTGRMHQIRRHLAMNGSPILGDDKYGDFKLNKKLQKEAGIKHLLLHACRLIIKDKEQIILDISAPPPDYFNFDMM